MKRNVNLSPFAIILTWVLIFIFIALPVYGYRDDMPMWLVVFLAVAAVALLISGLLYMPVSIAVDDRYLTIRRPLARKRLPLTDIQSVVLCPPTIAERRILGSGGFMGYWGWFYEASIGRYFAYYGKASDCFLVALKDGRRYLLGCKDPKDIIRYIAARITNN